MRDTFAQVQHYFFNSGIKRLADFFEKSKQEWFVDISINQLMEHGKQPEIHERKDQPSQI